MDEPALTAIPDDELLRRLGELVSRSRRVEAALVSHIGEVDARRLYAREACPSMFAYCTERLHLSEAEAYLRITVARAAREHTMLLTMLGDGRLHLSGIAKLVPLLSRENRDELLARATHLSKSRILELVAALAPRPDAPSVMRKLPQRRVPTTLRPGTAPTPPEPLSRQVELRPDAVAALPALDQGGQGSVGLEGSSDPGAVPFVRAPAPAAPRAVEPLSPARYRVQFTASAGLHAKLRRLAALMRSARKALSETETAPTSRHVPAAVRRAVSERDGGPCGYVDERGRRCSEPSGLQFHHRHPFGMGGEHSLANIGLLCASHNRYLAEQDYARALISRRSRPLRA